MLHSQVACTVLRSCNIAISADISPLVGELCARAYDMRLIFLVLTLLTERHTMTAVAAATLRTLHSG